MSEQQSDLCEDYVRDLGTLLRAYADEARADRDSDPTAFRNGYLSGFHRVVSLMQQQAEAFGIPAAALGLDDYDPDKELV